VEAVEGRDEREVVSPTYQEIQVGPSAREDQLDLLLVGAFGPHHFAASLTVTATPLGPLDHAQFVFDVVDRCRAGLTSLGASYALRLPVPRATNEEESSWGIPGGPETAVLLQAVSLNERMCRLTRIEPGVLPSIARVEAALVPGRASHRFVYSWAFASP
jgi:hypothetical protein